MLACAHVGLITIFTQQEGDEEEEKGDETMWSELAWHAPRLRTLHVACIACRFAALIPCATTLFCAITGIQVDGLTLSS